MLDEQYVFRPSMNLDISKLKEIVFRNINKTEPGLASHQRYVEKEPYLEELRQQYPFLSKLYNIYPTLPSFKVPIHICPERGCALNIPIQYTEDSYTIFYQAKEELKTRYSTPRIYKIIKSEMVETYRYTLTDPVIMNTRLPHSVEGGPRDTRIIMSWSITPLYEETKQLVGML